MGRQWADALDDLCQSRIDDGIRDARGALYPMKQGIRRPERVQSCAKAFEWAQQRLRNVGSCLPHS